MFGIPDLMTPRLSFYEFGKLLFLHTVILMSGIQKSQCHGKGSIFQNLEFFYSAHKKAVNGRQLTFCLDCIWIILSHLTGNISD